jgi:cysteine desulfurase
LWGGDPELVVFTSGATEAIATICRPREGQPFHAVATEHAAVLAAQQDGGFHAIPVDANGRPSANALSHDGLTAWQYANSETGVLLDPPSAAGPVFRDAVQIAGKLPVDINASGADVICISSHKIGGPQGAAAIIARSPEHLPQTLIVGGGQEKGRRGGTENVAAIAGFGAAADIAENDLSGFAERTQRLRDQFEAGLRDLANNLGVESVIHGEAARRLPNTSCFSLSGIEAATALMAMDISGISLSSGSACSSGKVGKSHVLEAMGVPDALAKAALRVSFGWNSGEDDAARILEVLDRELPRLLS